MSDPYLYPGLTVLKNRLGIVNAAELERMERLLVTQRMTEGAPDGQFDLSHLKAIHHHLFQDVYDWAGELRVVELRKGDQQFQFRQFIETGMADVHRRLVEKNFLGNLNSARFCAEAANVLGDVNYVHPFREGNGRAQLLYLEKLAAQAGHSLDLTRISPSGWIEASRLAHSGHYDAMAEEIERACEPRA